MPVNRNALIRFKTLDNCFRNRHRRWTLDDLQEACAAALYEYEGIDKGVSKRTVQMDIQLMRSDKLGYNAPIVVHEKKYYTYTDPEYSITNIPLTNQDLGKLTEVVEILRQFKGFSHFQDLSGMVQRLENKIHSAKTKQEPVIDFEKNENLKGLEHIETLYQAIIRKKAVELRYQSFKARAANEFVFHPYYLKEYRNRWFVLGVKGNESHILTLALDRIGVIQETKAAYIPPRGFNVSEYFEHVIGVTVNRSSPPEKVVLFADNATAPYILTKPIHHTQQLLETLSNGVVLSIEVQLNFELEREILGFGDRVKVMAPERLKRRIREIIENASDQYENELSETAVLGIQKKLGHKGFAMLSAVYTKKAASFMKATLHAYRTTHAEEEPNTIRNVLKKLPALQPMVMNSNLRMILRRIDPELFLTKAIFFDRTPDANEYVALRQDTTIQVKEMIETPGFTGWTRKADAYSVCPPDEVLKSIVTIRIHLDDVDQQNGALRVVPGSHNRKLRADEIQLIAQSSIPFVCNADSCGIQIMRPLLIHAISKSTSQKHRRVLHLEFSSAELPNGLQWAEKFDV